MKQVELKSIVPIKPQDGPVIQYRVVMGVGGVEEKWEITRLDQIDDFNQFQRIVTEKTGSRLDPELANRWKSKVQEVWGEPEEPSEGWDDMISEDDSPLSKAEVEEMSNDLREIYEMNDKPLDDED